jgi:hypothetical protein
MTNGVTLDTKLGTLLDDPQAKAVLDKHLPGALHQSHDQHGERHDSEHDPCHAQAAQLGLTKKKAEALLVEINKRV